MRTLGLVSLLALLVLPGFAQMPRGKVPPAVPSAAERELLALANADRARRGIGALAWDPALARAARLHAERMLRESGELAHQYAGEPDLTARAAYSGAHFAVVSENLARKAESPAEVERLWMGTAVHRANLLNPELNAAGISVLDVGGRLYVVEDFARVVASLQPGEIEDGVMRALRGQGIASVAVSEDARRVCRTGANPDNDGPQGFVLLVVQWDGPDPTELPRAVVAQLARKPFHAAAVGACPSQKPDVGFTNARVAVLLF